MTTNELRSLIVLPPELDVEFLFDLDHPYPPLVTIAHRLLTRYGIAEEQAMGLGGHKVEDIRSPDWTLWLPHGGPLPDLRSRHAFHTRTYCEVELRRVGELWNAHPVFAACGEYLARVAYPVQHGQQDAFDIIDPTTGEAVSPPAGPPYGGSPWAVGRMLAWYHALRQVEDWAKRNLPHADR